MAGLRSKSSDGTVTGIFGMAPERRRRPMVSSAGGRPINMAMACSYCARVAIALLVCASVISTWARAVATSPSVASANGWVAVTSEALPNGRFGWVEFGRDVSLQRVQWKLRASLSRRRLYVSRDGRIVRTIPIGIGVATSPTPLGRFAIAEKLTGAFGPAFGCCILALTARQPRLPVGWNRSITYYVAIHAGFGQGTAVSAGCLHATEANVRYLMRTVPLGTPVLISR